MATRTPSKFSPQLKAPTLDQLIYKEVLRLEMGKLKGQKKAAELTIKNCFKGRREHPYLHGTLSQRITLQSTILRTIKARIAEIEALGIL